MRLGEIVNLTVLVPLPDPSSPRSTAPTPVNNFKSSGSSVVSSKIPAIFICTPGPGRSLSTPFNTSVLSSGTISAKPSPDKTIPLVEDL